MGLQKAISPDNATLTIKVDGTFDLSQQAAFRAAYETDGKKHSHYIIDMRSTDYMDSAAFGMLLVLRDYAGGVQADIAIANANEDIKKSFKLLNFDRLFKIV